MHLLNFLYVAYSRSELSVEVNHLREFQIRMFSDVYLFQLFNI